MPAARLTWVLGFLLALHAGRSPAFEIDASTGEIAIKTLAGFDKCVLDLSEIPACLKALQRHADKRPNDAFQAGKRALLHYPVWTALPFFEIAFRKRATDAQCEDEDVFRAVSEGLSRPESDQTSLELARTLVTGKCSESLQERLVEAIGEEAGERFKMNACALLASRAVTVEGCAKDAGD